MSLQWRVSKKPRTVSVPGALSKVLKRSVAQMFAWFSSSARAIFQRRSGYRFGGRIVGCMCQLQEGSCNRSFQGGARSYGPVRVEYHGCQASTGQAKQV